MGEQRSDGWQYYNCHAKHCERCYQGTLKQFAMNVSPYELIYLFPWDQKHSENGLGFTVAIPPGAPFINEENVCFQRDDKPATFKY